MISPFAIPAPGSIGAGSNQVKASSSDVSASAEGSDLIGSQLVGPVLPSGIASEESVGAPEFSLPVYPSSIGSSAAVGPPRIGPVILPASIKAPGSILVSSDAIKASSAEFLASDYQRDLFGAPEIELIISEGSVSSGESFGYHNISPALPSGIVSEEVFGSATLLFAVSPGGLNTGENVPPPQIDLSTAAIGVNSEEVFGVPQIVQHLTPAGIASGEAFGDTDVNTLKPAGIASGEAVSLFQLNFSIAVAEGETASAIGAAQLNLSVTAVTISPPDPSFGGPLIELRLAASGVVSSESLGATELSLIGEPAGVASGEVFGTARVDTYTVIVGITSQEAFGTQDVDLVQMVYAEGIASDEAFGTTAFPFYIRPPGINTAEAIPLPDVLVAVIRPGLIEVAGQLGTPSIDFSLEIPGVASEEGVGLAQCDSSVDVVGIPSEETIGQAGVLTSVVPTTVQTSEAFGTPGAIHEVAVTGISTAEVIGQAQLNSLIDSNGITSSEAFGPARISAGLLPYGIVSLEDVPAPSFFDLVLYAPGIPTQESVGSPTVGEPVEAQIIEPNFLASKEEFGTPTLRDHITTVGIPSETVFGYIPSITESHELFVPDIIYSEEAFGEPLVLPNYTVSPGALNSTPAITPVALGQRHVLTLSDINAYPTQSIFVLLQNHQLAVEQAAATPGIPSVLLSQNYQLVAESVTSTPFMSHVYFGGLSYFGDPGVESGSDVKAYRDKLADQVVSSPEYGFRTGMLSSTPVAVVVGIVLASNDEVTSDAGDVSASGAILEFVQRTVISSRGHESADSGYADKLPNEVISIGSKGLSSGALSVYPDRDTVITNRGLAGSGTKGWRGKRTG